MRLAITLVAATSLFLIGCSDDKKNNSDVGVHAQANAQNKANAEYNRSIKAKIYNKMADMVRRVELKKNEDGSLSVTLVGRSSLWGSGDCTFNIDTQNTWHRGAGTKLSSSHKKCSDVMAKVQNSGEFTTVSFNGIYTSNTEFKAFFRTLNLTIADVRATQDSEVAQKFANAVEGKTVQVQIANYVWPTQIANMDRDALVIDGGELDIEGEASPSSTNENLSINTDSDGIHLGEFHVNAGVMLQIKKNVEIERLNIEFPAANFFSNSDRLRGSRVEIITDNNEVSATAVLK